ncbi:MAG: CBS domain-containing protein [Sphingomonadales bacterium]
MNVKSILKIKGADVVTVAPDISITQFAAVLCENRIGAAIVCDGKGSMIGMISERDIARGLYRHGAKALELTVSDLMTSNVHSCGPDDSIIDVMAMMTDRRIRHIPVVEGDGLIGVVSIGDVVKHRIEEAEQDAEAMRQYIATV